MIAHALWLLVPAASASAIVTAAAPITVKWWDIDAAVRNQQLDYEEQALAFALQGLVNSAGAPPTLMMKAGFLDFDWPDADSWWRGQLEAAGRVQYTNLTSTLCGLVDGAAAGPGQVAGVVLYENAESNGTGYTLPMALTLASQQLLLPVTVAVLTKHSACLSRFKVVQDLRIAKMVSLRQGCRPSHQIASCHVYVTSSCHGPTELTTYCTVLVAPSIPAGDEEPRDRLGLGDPNPPPEGLHHHRLQPVPLRPGESPPGSCLAASPRSFVARPTQSYAMLT